MSKQIYFRFFIHFLEKRKDKVKRKIEVLPKLTRGIFLVHLPGLQEYP